mgnify:CR=1 FL=1
MRRAAIVSPLRTPVGKFQGALASMQAGDLGAVIIRALVQRSGIDPERIDDVVFAQGYANGEAPCIARWSALAADHKVDLVVCVAAALRRGIKEEVLAPGFRISGLGQLVDAGIKADRTVTFGD